MINNFIFTNFLLYNNKKIITNQFTSIEKIPQKSRSLLFPTRFRKSFEQNALCFTKATTISAVFKDVSKLAKGNVACLLIYGSTQCIIYPCECKASAILMAGEPLKSSISGLKAKPRRTIRGLLCNSAEALLAAILICLITHCVLLSFTFLAVAMRRAFSGSLCSKKPWVHSNAMAPNPCPWLQNIHTWMMICKCN